MMIDNTNAASGSTTCRIQMGQLRMRKVNPFHRLRKMGCSTAPVRGLNDLEAEIV